MQVLKFGGSSLADAANMLKAADIIARAVDRDRTIVIASAIYKCTDTLIQIGFHPVDRHNHTDQRQIVHVNSF